MADKKKDTDVLADVLSDTHDHHVPGLDELAKLIRPRAKPVIEKKVSKGRLKKKRSGAKKKTTHYLSEEVFAELGDARDRLQEMLPGENPAQVSKSGIVNTALKMILRELEEKGKSSDLYRQIIKEKEEK